MGRAAREAARGRDAADRIADGVLELARRRRRRVWSRPVSDAPFAGRELHFVGIGGAGMSGLALVARALGARVTGSDRADSPYCEPLRAPGSSR